MRTTRFAIVAVLVAVLAAACSSDDGTTTSETCDRRSTYGYQLDAFIAAVERGEPLFTDADDGVKQMRLIDRCYEAAGMRLHGER